jgi:hypothetical protein
MAFALWPVDLREASGETTGLSAEKPGSSVLASKMRLSTSQGIQL